MFIELTNRFHHRIAEGEKILINFDNVVYVRRAGKNANLTLSSENFKEFLCIESVEEIVALLAEAGVHR